ncbi:MAG: methyltransferase domain-containing protein [Candidatus Binataceae bacterium]
MIPFRAENSAYDAAFFDSHVPVALESARVVVPLMLRLMAVRSVVDVGCGIGAWLHVFEQNGVPDICGLDGEYVARERLMFDVNRFVTTDLGGDFHIPARFDLAVCVEVAEHLPTRSSPHLLDELTSAAPVILFSAALPHQGGRLHVNEQWPDYWIEHFRTRGYLMADALRPLIWHDPRVAWWYRQNLVVFASEAALAANAELRRQVELSADCDLVLIHRNIIGALQSPRFILRSVPWALGRVPLAAWRRIRRRWPHLRSAVPQ